MATTNAGNGNSNDGKPRYNKGVEGEKKDKRIYTADNRSGDRPRNDYKRTGGGEGYSKGNGEYKPRNNNGEYKPRNNNGEYKPRNNNGEYKPRNNNGEYKPKNNNGEYKPRNNGEYKPRSNDGTKRSYGNGGYSNSAFNSRGFDKDKDEDTPVRRQKPKTDNKPKEQQPDKFEIINRIEKEKKAMKKKHSESRGDSRPAKHTVRPKRSGNIDWTREYENDSYDDDDLDMYL